MPASTKRRKLVPLIMMGVGILLIFAAVASIAMFSPQQAANLPTPSAQAQAALPVPYPDVKRISLQDAKAALDLEAAVFVDVRGKEWYDQEHILGALSIPEDELEARMKELEPTAWIITYCS